LEKSGLCDTLKTVAACGAAYYATAPLIGQASILYAGLGAVLGHNYPAWARFRGGKGVAVTCVWLACQRCGLCETRTHVVFGQGVPDAEVLFGLRSSAAGCRVAINNVPCLSKNLPWSRVTDCKRTCRLRRGGISSRYFCV